MTWLMIENPGVAPVTAFTVLGATTVRETEIPHVIGTFGSGANLGTLDLIRHSLYPVVYLDKLRLEFFTSPLHVVGIGTTVDHRQVNVRFSGVYNGRTKNKTEKLSWTTAWGQHDWGPVELALREYVSNAIDAVLMAGNDVSQVKNLVTVVIVDDNQVRAKAGYTRIFVPITEEVKDFHKNLSRWFLHFYEEECLSKRVLAKSGRNIDPTYNRAVIYRRGVRVREFESEEVPSLFDYNLYDLQLNESRTVDDWVVQDAAGRCLAAADPEVLTKVFLSLAGKKHYWEHDFQKYCLKPSIGLSEEELKKVQTNWQEALECAFGEDAVLVAAEADFFKQQCARKGFRPVPVPEGWIGAARELRISTDFKVLSEDDRRGLEFFEPTEALKESLQRLWANIVFFGMNNGREIPKLSMFFEQMRAESERFGFYKTDTVFVHRDYCQSPNEAMDLTVLEELAHHVTGAGDNSRDLQQWLFRFVSLLMKNVKN